MSPSGDQRTLAYRLHSDQGETIWMFDALDTIKAAAEHTGGAFTLVEFHDFQDSSVPVHSNDRWDRGFYVLEGEYQFVLGDETTMAASGTWIFVPRGTPHAWRCHSSEGRLLNVTAPAGFEGFYREVGKPVADRSQLPARSEPDVAALAPAAARYGVTIVGPPPGG